MIWIILVVFLGKTLNCLSASLHPSVKWVPANNFNVVGVMNCNEVVFHPGGGYRCQDKSLLHMGPPPFPTLDSVLHKHLQQAKVAIK